MPRLLDEIDEDSTVDTQDLAVTEVKTQRPQYIRKGHYEVGFEKHVVENLYDDVKSEVQSRGIQFQIDGPAPWQRLEYLAFCALYPENKPEELQNEFIQFKKYLKGKGLVFLDLMHNRDLEKYHQNFKKWQPLLVERAKTFIIDVDEEGNFVAPDMFHEDDTQETPIVQNTN
jgi:hypothetical protein